MLELRYIVYFMASYFIKHYCTLLESIKYYTSLSNVLWTCFTGTVYQIKVGNAECGTTLFACS